ncbi:MAG TPA: nitrogen regulation protein NR(I), partial [Myxococcales bacterium]|nr:nitrogen regulation protein NR(I) [Myxococcales bacterium]
RLDLFYRIAVVRLDVMPLRDRPRDIPMLIEHFIAQAGRSGAAEELFDAETLERLRNHPWPGNVRE